MLFLTRAQNRTATRILSQIFSVSMGTPLTSRLWIQWLDPSQRYCLYWKLQECFLCPLQAASPSSVSCSGMYALVSHCGLNCLSWMNSNTVQNLFCKTCFGHVDILFHGVAVNFSSFLIQAFDFLPLYRCTWHKTAVLCQIHPSAVFF